MTPSNQTSNDFRVALSVRIEGRNCRALLLQLLSLLVAIIAAGVRLAAWVQHSSP